MQTFKQTMNTFALCGVSSVLAWANAYSAHPHRSSDPLAERKHDLAEEMSHAANEFVEDRRSKEEIGWSVEMDQWSKRQAERNGSVLVDPEVRRLISYHDQASPSHIDVTPDMKIALARTTRTAAELADRTSDIELRDRAVKANAKAQYQVSIDPQARRLQSETERTASLKAAQEHRVERGLGLKT